MIIAELSVTPLGTGSTGVSKYVKAALEELKKSGVKFELGAMSTTIETENMETLFSVVKKAHEAVFLAGAKRVVTTLKIDDRRDKDASITSKLEALK